MTPMAVVNLNSPPMPEWARVALAKLERAAQDYARMGGHSTRLDQVMAVIRDNAAAPASEEARRWVELPEPGRLIEAMNKEGSTWIEVYDPLEPFNRTVKWRYYEYPDSRANIDEVAGSG